MIIKLGDAYPNKYDSCAGRIYSDKGDAPTVRTPTGGYDTDNLCNIWKQLIM